MFWKRTPRLRNPKGIPKQLLGLIELDFCHVEYQRKGLTFEVLRYVADGEGDAVLETLKGVPDVHSLLRLIGSWAWQRSGANERELRVELFSHPDLRDPDVLYRLARVYHAASDTRGRQRTPNGLRPGEEWMETLLSEARSRKETGSTTPPWDAQLLEAIAVAGGHSPDMVVRGLLFYTPGQYTRMTDLLTPVEGLLDALARYPETVRAAMAQEHFKSICHALHTLAAVGWDPRPFAKDLAVLAAQASKHVCDAALMLLERIPEAAVPELETLIAEGESTQRFQAVRSLWTLRGAGARAFLESRLSVESNRKTADEIRRLLGFHDLEQQEEGGGEDIEPLEFDLPPVPEFASRIPLSAELREAVNAFIHGLNRSIRIHQRGIRLSNTPHMPPGPLELEDLVKPADAERALAYLETGEDAEAAGNLLKRSLAGYDFQESVRVFIATGPFDPVQFWRFLHLLGIVDDSRQGWSNCVYYLESYLKRHPEWQDLRVQEAARRSAGLPDDVIEILHFTRDPWSPFRLPNLPPEAVWPYYTENRDRLMDYLRAAANGEYTHDRTLSINRKRALAVLALFPRVPAWAAGHLWEIALGDSKTDRPLAQAALARFPAKVERLVAALTNSKKTVRAAAAEWLSRCDAEAAIPALEQALRKEKHDGPRVAMMEALERLGAPLERFVRIEDLHTEAIQGLKKEPPKALFWFPFEQLPAVHWQSSGAPVSPEILRWWIVQSCRLDSAEPAPFLRIAMRQVRGADRERLAEHLLQTWIARDTGPRYTPDDAAALARKETREAAEQIRRDPEAWRRWDEVRFLEKTLKKYLDDCSGSAYDTRGILAVVAAAAGVSVIPIVQGYLKQWYGYRVHQCKAMLRMLSWVDHPRAVQVVLSVGTRFRTKSIQAEALAVADQMAERKGWSKDQLADRMIPTAGLDETGVLELDCGGRVYTARLDAALRFELRNPEGRVVQALPKPRLDDDNDQSGAAARLLAACRKELKETLAHQKQRLYEAMVTQRCWRYEDWDRFLLRHPILRDYCQRLVWMTSLPDGGTIEFRPLSDGRLVNASGETVTIGLETEIRIAHRCVLTPESAAAWERQQKDDRIDPPFNQFEGAPYALSEDLREATMLMDYEGFMVDRLKLRGRMRKEGYFRGDVVDHGWFCSYHRRFPGLSLEAAIEFTGGYLPEESGPVALIGLWFLISVRDEWSGGKEGVYVTPLGEVPPILLAECWNALRRAAEDGTGYDPEWRAKTDG